MSDSHATGSRAATGSTAVEVHLEWPQERVTIDVVDYVDRRRRIVARIWSWIAFPIEDWLFRGEQRVVDVVEADQADREMMGRV